MPDWGRCLKATGAAAHNHGEPWRERVRRPQVVGVVLRSTTSWGVCRRLSTARSDLSGLSLHGKLRLMVREPRGPAPLVFRHVV